MNDQSDFSFGHFNWTCVLEFSKWASKHLFRVQLSWSCHWSATGSHMLNHMPEWIPGRAAVDSSEKAPQTASGACRKTVLSKPASLIGIEVPVLIRIKMRRIGWYCLSKVARRSAMIWRHRFLEDAEMMKFLVRGFIKNWCWGREFCRRHASACGMSKPPSWSLKIHTRVKSRRHLSMRVQVNNLPKVHVWMRIESFRGT